jgi:hypothetical protein
LAPLDFDMAFTKDTFSKDEEQWQEWMALERAGILGVLAGDDQLSTGVTATAPLPRNYATLRYALR